MAATPVHFTHLKDLQKHMTEEHFVDSEKVKNPLAMATDGLILLPSDLRKLHCRLCGDETTKMMLAQDRLNLSGHIKHRHELNIPKHVLKYSCRICPNQFDDSNQLFAHPCYAAFSPESSQTVNFSDDTTRGNPYMINLGQQQKKDKPEEEEEEGSKDMEQCVYCEKKVEKQNKASHRGRHFDLDFQCAKCTKFSKDLAELMDHFVAAHNANLESLENPTARKLYDKGLLIMPADIRAVRCSHCDVVFLCQDRGVLVKHMQRNHPDEPALDKADVTYSCRSCGNVGYKSSKEVFEHGCFLKPAGSALGERGSSQDGKPDPEAGNAEEEQFIERSAIEWEDPVGGESGDLRRLACKLCGLQINGERFFNMIAHLEQKHDKFQLNRFVAIDIYVHFGCANCERFQPSVVQTWDRHFLNDSFTHCEGMGVLPPPPQVEEKEASTSQVVDEVSHDEVENKEQEQEEEAKCSEDDIRALYCKLCDGSFLKADYAIIQWHLRSSHTKETIRSPFLDAFVKFGCLKCPDFMVDKVGQWKSHFYRSNTLCKESYKKALDEELASDGKDRDQVSGDDLRKLMCLVCKDFTGKDFVVMTQHFESDHSDKSSMLETNIYYGCVNCPRFSPDSVIRWDRHFSKDYRRCQGSARIEPDITSSSKKKSLFWCDACRETREDIEKHFLGRSHETVVSRIKQKEDFRDWIECRPCNVKVTTRANFKLHEDGPYHKKNVNDEEESKSEIVQEEDQKCDSK